MSPTPHKHFFLIGNVESEKYKSPSARGAQPRIPARDRATQSQKLLQQFATIWQQKEQLQQQRNAEQIATREGTYIQFTSSADHDLITKSLEDLRKGIRLLNIKEIPVGENQAQIRATVYVPNGKEGHFISKIQKYQDEETAKGQPKNARLVNSIEEVSIALLEGLWTDKPQLIPTDVAKWIEAWLNVNTKDNQEQEQIAQFFATLDNIGIAYKHNSIIFPERAVLLVNANREQLIELMLQSDLLAEFRAGQEPAGFWVNESSVEQQAWTDNLLQRIELVESNVKVCLLDSGVNNGHQLLKPLIDDANTLTVDNAWGTDDHEPRAGHGTLMAGLAGYGQMEQVLLSQDVVPITHKLCSVKILPRPNQAQTPRELWGYITIQGVARAEIQNPNMVLVYCMSVTSQEDTDKGRPSSWSGAIDNLAYGEGENHRLIIVSAGNIRDEEMWRNYPQSNETSPVQNPAQAWNALVVGAYTEKIQITAPNFQNHIPVANEGQLSPYSSTSLTWEQRKWPVKPDVVFEGGNLLRAPDNSVTAHEDLELLSTSRSFNIKPFDTINATSAAAAQASWFAAKIAYEYPNAWPETIRGLMVHSANWHQAMLAQMQVQQGNRASYRNLLRTFGYGVPDLDRALYSQESALTYIAQETIQPFNFKEESSTTETNEIHFFNLPWASDLLLQMSETPVKLKITLSYFIEPGAGEIGWKDKYRYQSHGLRFDVNNVGESEEDFRKRVNIAAREENEEVNGNTGSNRWVIGTNNRSTGSIHSDYWEGTAAALATCNHIAVYPVIGWWRERKHLGKVKQQTRYSLIISLDTPAQDVELYTTVRNMIEVPVEVLANTTDLFNSL
ncbi:MAG: S8 family peptidase [Flavobacteriales bacterium]